MLTLSASNTFSGTTTVSNGTLMLNNNLALQNSAEHHLRGQDCPRDWCHLAEFRRPERLVGQSSHDHFQLQQCYVSDVEPWQWFLHLRRRHCQRGRQYAAHQDRLGHKGLSGSNTYTGSTFISAGTLNAGNASALLASGNIVFGGGYCNTAVPAPAKIGGALKTARPLSRWTQIPSP